MRAALLVLVLLAGTGCEPRSGAVAAPTSPDAACQPLPAACDPEQPIECVVETRPGGVKVCSGANCCQDFCQLNGCAACCSTAP
jgi:hypothetical protein